MHLHDMPDTELLRYARELTAESVAPARILMSHPDVTLKVATAHTIGNHSVEADI